jgi:23S rRNA (cytidine1920-2'-O)/16S rRNA (cytidine1409-2'-O)-methyltransferase
MKQRLDQLIVERGLLPTRAKAQALIMAGRVRVDGKRSDKAGHFVKDDSRIEVDPGPRYVSRAGAKLESVADKLGLVFGSKVVLDVGSSTGGFTDYALQKGAKKVYAVDVGTHQLDPKLRADPKVELHEKTDIRDVGSLPDKPDIVMIDVSFISLRLVLPAVARLINKETQVVAMAKPHFEADRKTASMHKGVIKNDTIRRRILKDLEMWFQSNGWLIADKADSEVAGAKGNIERFYLLRFTPEPRMNA